MVAKLCNVIKRLKYLMVFLLMTAVFQTNFLATSSEYWFRTYLDTSEALVLGKILADLKGIDAGSSNLLLIDKAPFRKSPNVLAVYPRVDNPDSIIPFNLTDGYWENGFHRYENILLLNVAGPGALGYSENELAVGIKLSFQDGLEREVTKLVHTSYFLHVYYSGDRIDGRKAKSPYKIKIIDDRPYEYSVYPQQFGIQGITLSWLYRHVPFIDSVYALQLIMAMAMAATLTLLIKEYARSISVMFAVTFALVMIGSPFVVYLSRNLYWASFLWFLPSVAAMLIYRTEKGNSRQFIAMGFYCFAIFLKCLAGYEYITSIVLFSMMIFVIAPFQKNAAYSYKTAAKYILLLGILSILGFALAIIIHAANRADSLAEGLRQIFVQDALKYNVLGGKFGTQNVNELTPISSILNEYVAHWKIPVLFWINWQYMFLVMLLLAAISLVVQFYKKDFYAKRDTVLLTFTSLAPLSWLILMHKHAAIHTHLDYVLWYFGFIPSVIFVIIRSFPLITNNKTGISTVSKL